jgi:glucose-6-phosphate 1-dehydrogenase
MEPPSSFSSKALIDEKVKIFDSMPDIVPERVVRGQYEGYRDEAGVAKDSETETFVAMEAAVDNWRWEGVPFFLRTGKRMAERRSAITLAFRNPPKMLFPDVAWRRFHHDHLTLDLGPEEGITLTFLAKKPGPSMQLTPAHMHFDYDRDLSSGLIDAYERLILDVLLGERQLFTRADGIERTWEMIQGLLDDPPLLHRYPAGSWGPEAADEVIQPRHWHLPTKHAP